MFIAGPTPANPTITATKPSCAADDIICAKLDNIADRLTVLEAAHLSPMDVDPPPRPQFQLPHEGLAVIHRSSVQPVLNDGVAGGGDLLAAGSDLLDGFMEDQLLTQRLMDANLQLRRSQRLQQYKNAVLMSALQQKK